MRRQSVTGGPVVAHMHRTADWKALQAHDRTTHFSAGCCVTGLVVEEQAVLRRSAGKAPIVPTRSDLSRSRCLTALLHCLNICPLPPASPPTPAGTLPSTSPSSLSAPCWLTCGQCPGGWTMTHSRHGGRG
jgi:hypothetical protein